VPTRSAHAEGHSGHATRARRTPTWRGRRPLAGTETVCAGLGRPCVCPGPSPPGPHGAPHGHDRDARTQGVGPCQSTYEATAPREPQALPNQQAQGAPAEVGEGRELAKGNAGQHTRGRTPGRAALSRALDRGRQAAQERGKRLTARWPHVSTMDRLREASYRRNHDAAPGVDGQTWAAYGEPLDTKLRQLSDRLQRGAYQAPPVARVSRPKADGRQRPIGTPTGHVPGRCG
jgi:hypothetical protein